MVNGTEVNAIVEDRAQAKFLTEMDRPPHDLVTVMSLDERRREG